MVLSSEPPSLPANEGLPPVFSDEGASSSTGEETSASICQACTSRALPASRPSGASTNGGTPAPASAAPNTPDKEGASPSIPDAPDAPPSTHRDTSLRALTPTMAIERSASTNRDGRPTRLAGGTASPAPAQMSRGRRILGKLGILKRPSASATATIEADDILLVVGHTGSGMSTFINALPLNGPRMDVDDTLSACTREVQHSFVNVGDRRIVLVDTPGFNNSDPDKTDDKVLEEILTWLKASFPPGAKYRGGVIYLQDLTLNPQRQASEWLFVKTLCGIWNQRLVMVTTKWSRLGGEEGQKRHSFLEEYWTERLEPGTRIEPCKEEGDAWGIVQSFLPSLESNEVDVGKRAAKIARRSPSRTPFMTRFRARKIPD